MQIDELTVECYRNQNIISTTTCVAFTQTSEINERLTIIIVSVSSISEYICQQQTNQPKPISSQTKPKTPLANANKVG